MQPINWSGIDVAKATFDGAILAWDQNIEVKNVIRKSFQRSKNGVKKYIAWMDRYLEKALGKPEEGHHAIRVVMDSTGGYSLELCLWLLQARSGLEPAICNPRILKRHREGLGIRNKTDDIDSRAHCVYGYERKPKPYKPLPESYQKLKALVQERAYLITLRAAEKVRAKEPLLTQVIIKTRRRHLRYLDREVKKLELKIKQTVANDTDLDRDVKLLVTIPGIGLMTAAVVLSYLGDLRRFVNTRELSAFSGLSPRRVESGMFKGTTRISRMGSPELRAALFMPAMSMIKGDHPLACAYERLVNRGMSKKSAMCAIMRKSLIIMRAMLINNEPYRMTSIPPKTQEGKTQPLGNFEHPEQENEKIIETGGREVARKVPTLTPNQVAVFEEEVITVRDLIRR